MMKNDQMSGLVSCEPLEFGFYYYFFLQFSVNLLKTVIERKIISIAEMIPLRPTIRLMLLEQLLVRIIALERRKIAFCVFIFCCFIRFPENHNK